MTPDEALQAAHDAGLTLPGPAWFVAAILFSVAGLVAWRWGKAVRNAHVKWLGVALMFYGYVVRPVWLLWAVGIALCVAIWWFRDERD